LALLAAGYLAKRAGFLTTHDGGVLLRVVFHLTLPPLVFLSILHAQFDNSLMRLSLLAPVVCGVSLLVVALLRRSVLRTVDRRLFGAFLTGSVVMNTGFLLPFVERLCGPEGLARLVVIDAFVALTTFTLVYAVVVRVARDDTPDVRYVLHKLLASQPLWGLAAAAFAKLTHVTPPATLLDAFDLAARATGPLILIALGLKFDPKIRQPGLLLLSISVRFGLGALLGTAFVWFMDLDGLDARLAVFAAMAPIGFNAITFAELEKLDVEFAAAQVSVGLITAIAASPLTTQLIHR
jgi:malate permease and related proteins